MWLVPPLKHPGITLSFRQAFAFVALCVLKCNVPWAGIVVTLYLQYSWTFELSRFTELVWHCCPPLYRSSKNPVTFSLSFCALEKSYIWHMIDLHLFNQSRWKHITWIRTPNIRCTVCLIAQLHTPLLGKPWTVARQAPLSMVQGSFCVFLCITYTYWQNVDDLQF